MLLARGEVTLVLGTATVSVSRIPADALVILCRKSTLGTPGLLDWSITPDTSFTIASLNILDTSIVRWAVMV